MKFLANAKRNFIWTLILVLFGMATISMGADVKELTLRVRSRMYLDFKEDHKVKMNEKFQISDTDMQGVVVEFYPDFSIDTLTHKAISRSDTLYNPAAKVLIIKGKEKQEEVWAFPPGMMPHYSAKSFIGFELLDFKTSNKYKKPIPKTPATEKENE